MVILSVLGGNTESSTTKTSSVSESVSPTPVVTNSPTSAATPGESSSLSSEATPTASPTPESPIEFRFAALRDLKDLRKDVSDARIGITGDGLGKFYWNVATITLNLVQLETRVPREEYAVRWNEKLAILKIAVEDLGSGGDELTITKAKAQLNRVLNAIPALERIANSLAN